MGNPPPGYQTVSPYLLCEDAERAEVWVFAQRVADAPR
jgi:hypothetical protein